MKVLCIKDSPDFGHTRQGVITIPDNLKVKCGEIYTVSREVRGFRGEKKWELIEKPKHCRYKKEYFSFLSDVEQLNEIKLEVQTSF